MANFDARLIPEFSGENSNDSIAEWYSKAKWVCKLHKVTDITLVLPLRLTGYAYKIYDQLSEEEKLNEEKVKSALFKAFEADTFLAYEQLHDRKLERGEPVDAYLADIQRLAALAGGLTEKAICSAFVFGLPDHVRRTLRTNSRMSEMTVMELLKCARAILADEASASAGAREITWPGARPRSVARQSRPASEPRRRSPVCYSCGLPGHYQRGCARRAGTANRFRRRQTSGSRAQHDDGGLGLSGSAKNDNRDNSVSKPENLRWE